MKFTTNIYLEGFHQTELWTPHQVSENSMVAAINQPWAAVCTAILTKALLKKKQSWIQVFSHTNGQSPVFLFGKFLEENVFLEDFSAVHWCEISWFLITILFDLFWIHLFVLSIWTTPVVLLTGDPHIKSSAYRSICLHDTNMAMLYTILPLTLLFGHMYYYWRCRCWETMHCDGKA